ncbi:MAG: type II toxin-antitoxin system Phd/YefM family antitoxin [Clostridiales bacterium]|jgi:prevent-host-death family protein|nr:type II toxin-antitoxin system Phd/YefM family antitoxin [Clostridiales bacterium]
MPTIRPSAYLRNNYNEVSEFCHSRVEPVFITKNGHGDLVVLSIEAYEKLCGRTELYHLLDEAIEAEKNGDFMDYDEFISDMRKDMA